jgi:hypothetical protein
MNQYKTVLLKEEIELSTSKIHNFLFPPPSFHYHRIVNLGTSLLDQKSARCFCQGHMLNIQGHGGHLNLCHRDLPVPQQGQQRQPASKQAECRANTTSRRETEI